MPGLVVHLAHGASAGAASMRPHVSGLRARGLRAETVQLPRGSAERAVPAYRQAAPDATASIIGGHSFGGRVASLLAAEKTYAGLVLLSYPLHAHRALVAHLMPGAADQRRPRPVRPDRAAPGGGPAAPRP